MIAALNLVQAGMWDQFGQSLDMRLLDHVVFGIQDLDLALNGLEFLFADANVMQHQVKTQELLFHVKPNISEEDQEFYNACHQTQ